MLENAKASTSMIKNAANAMAWCRLIARFLQEIVRCYHRDYTIRSVTLTRHAEVFRAEGFVPVREWKEYVAMEYGKNRRP